MIGLGEFKPSVVVDQDPLQALGVAAGDGPVHDELGVLVGRDVPVGCEQQAVTPQHPHLLVLQWAIVNGPNAAALRVPLHVGHPLAVIGRRHHVLPEVMPCGVGPVPILQVQP